MSQPFKLFRGPPSALELELVQELAKLEPPRCTCGHRHAAHGESGRCLHSECKLDGCLQYQAGEEAGGPQVSGYVRYVRCEGCGWSGRRVSEAPCPHCGGVVSERGHVRRRVA